MRTRIVTTLCLILFACSGLTVAESKPNVLIITVDDMSCDSVGAFGCQLAETTPNIDEFARRGMRFLHAHVQVGNCFPSRNVMFSGRYPHNTGVEGFYPVKEPKHLHLVDVMQRGEYFVGIRGKATHSTPYYPYHWDVDLSVLDGQKQDIKNAESYYKTTQRGIELAKAAEKPFCFNVNISDPHKPFYATGKRGETIPDKNVPSKVFTPEEVPIPGFLFDHHDVRKELSQYYSSVRRADDCFAATMKALRESGQEENTVVIFLSDHGMPLPFAKTALWNHSTHTPWIVHWPGVTKANSVDSEHMISAVDLLPTVLDIVGLPHPEGFDGHSFMPLLKGESQPERDMVYKVYNENSGGNRSPMRSVQSKKFGYLFNPWSDGNRVFKTATTGTMTYRAMQSLSATNPTIAARLEFFNHGVPEEFYDYETDPDALHNLIHEPKYAKQIEEHRTAMRKFMHDSNDPVLAVFNQREDAAARSAYVDQVQAESDARRKNRRGKSASKPKQNKNLFKLMVPKQAERKSEFVVTIQHALPKKLGEQMFHVTLKDQDGKRIERIVKTASGKGELSATFQLPNDLQAEALVVSAFVGEEYNSNLLHRTEDAVPVSD